MSELTFDDWIATRPECIQGLADRFPPRTVLRLPDGATVYVVGYAEMKDSAPWLHISEIDPLEDYEQSIATMELLCADHFQGATC